jgi:hypothetical protein
MISQNNYKPYSYTSQRAVFDYPLTLWGEIKAEDLDKAPNGYEAGLRANKRSQLIDFRFEYGTEKNCINDREDKLFLAEKLNDYIVYIQETNDNDTEYKKKLLNAILALQLKLQNEGSRS